jgi:hypothetical protein
MGMNHDMRLYLLFNDGFTFLNAESNDKAFINKQKNSFSAGIFGSNAFVF